MNLCKASVLFYFWLCEKLHRVPFMLFFGCNKKPWKSKVVIWLCLSLSPVLLSEVNNLWAAARARTKPSLCLQINKPIRRQPCYSSDSGIFAQNNQCVFIYGRKVHSWMKSKASGRSQREMTYGSAAYWEWAELWSIRLPIVTH